MNRKAISVALATLLLASGAAFAEQTTNPDLAAAYEAAGVDPTTLPQQVDPNQYSGLPDGVDPNAAQGGTLSNDMQAMVDQIVNQQKGQTLSGDEGLACEAIICLSSATRPGECAASLARYFGINLSKPWKTIQARINFLKMCPSSTDTPQMSNLVDAIGNGAGRCDAATLNVVNRRWIGENEYEIDSTMPSYCDAYFSHEYTDINSLKPHYVDRFVVRSYTDSEGNVINEYDGGYWVDGTTSLPTSVATSNAIPASKDRAGVGF